MRQECQEQKRRAILSRCLVEHARATLARGEQVILFLNRRGYSTFVHCTACGWTQNCSRCAINMTFHRQLARSWCHYCGETASRPDSCPDCQAPGVKLWGFGTERIAEEVAATFPGARIERMDSDTMTTRGAYERAFNRLRRLEVDILMGTQMIAKGLDLPQVTLVGVLHADIALAFPDFRAAERTFQLVAQVAGRAGRGPAGGQVVVQCYRPDHYAITAARHHDYHRFAAAELEFRRQAGYPPTTELIRILIDGADAEEVRVASLNMRDRCLAIAASGVGIAPGDMVLLGPVAAPIARLKGRHRVHLLLKLASSKALIALSRHHAETLLENPRRRPGHRGGVKVTIDVNPIAML
jgi:primosomal protein N' (replication factor Y)